MKARIAPFTIVMLVGAIIGCDKPKEQTSAPASSPVAIPTTSAPAAVTSEPPADLRARAAQLGAMPFSELSKMKIGDEAVFLLQAKTHGAVYGSNPYTIDSFPPTAAVHAGLLKDGEWGFVKLKVIHHKGNHPGTDANGVKSRNWATLDRSYSLSKVD